MSYKRSPLFAFVPAKRETRSPPLAPRNHLRKRASTGDSVTKMVLRDTALGEARIVYYKIFMRNVDLPRLQEEMVNDKFRHPKELDEKYENICLTVGSTDECKATCVFVIEVYISPVKEWMSTGSDLYLHYLMDFRRKKMNIVAVKVESSPHVVDRIAAHNDYTLCRDSNASN